MKNYDELWDKFHEFTHYMDADKWDNLGAYRDEGEAAIALFIRFVEGSMEQCIRCGSFDVEHHDQALNPYCEYCWDDLFN